MPIKIFFLFILLSFEINSLSIKNPISKNMKPETLKKDLNDNDEEDIIIIHTNDVHCGLNDNIGYDGLMLYKKELQKRYKYILTVDAGDHIQGNTYGFLSKGIEIINIMNMIGYDVATIGNQEFAYELEGLLKCNETLNCGYTNANFCYRKNKTSIFPKYVIKEIGNKKIAFIGLLTPQTLTKTNLFSILDEKGEMVYSFLAGQEGKEFYETAQKYINETKQYGADYVIILSHLGNDTDAKEYASSALISNTNGVNAVIDAHSHKVYSTTFVNKDGEKIPLVQTGQKLNYIGILKIKSNGTITSELISDIPKPVNDTEAEKVIRNNKEIWVDKEMKDYIDNLTKSYDNELNEKIGYISFDLVDEKDGIAQVSRLEEVSIGNLITDAIRSIGKADISLICARNIKKDLKKGDIVYKNIIDILPFYDEVIVKEVKGQDILNALEYGVRFLPNKSPKFLQVSGICFKIDKSIESTVEVDENDIFIGVKGNRRVYDVKVGDKKIDINKNYTISFDNNIGSGGDGYSMFRNCKENLNTNISSKEALLTYIKEELKGNVPDRYKNTQERIIIKEKPKDEDHKNNEGINLSTVLIIIGIIILILLIILTIFIIYKKKKSSPGTLSADLDKGEDNNLLSPA